MNTVEHIYQQASVLPPQDIENLVNRLSEIIKPKTTQQREEDFWIMMWRKGAIDKLPPTPSRRMKMRPRLLIKAEGKPLSQIIIEERR